MSTEWCVYSGTVLRFSRRVLWIYTFHKGQANITRAERIMFYTDSQRKAFKERSNLQADVRAPVGS